MKSHIPNLFTAANLFCGCLAIYFANQANLSLAAIFILIGAAFDFFDGMVARLLGVSSAIGEQLDSLADVVSFGVAPSFIAFQLLQVSWPNSNWNFLAFIIAILSAFRLAKFNVDSRQSDQFIGLPTPANALLWVSISLSIWQSEHLAYAGWISQLLTDLSQNPIVVLALTVIFSLLLIAELPLISLKFKHFKWKGNEYRFLLLISSAVFIGLFLFASVPFILLLYLIFSLIQNSKSKANEIQS